MDYLWTPWRYAYVTGAEHAGDCIFCQAPKQTDEPARIVLRGTHCYVILNTYPYTNGHVMVVPYAHLDELQRLPADAAQEMMALSQRIVVLDHGQKIAEGTPSEVARDPRTLSVYLGTATS